MANNRTGYTGLTQSAKDGSGKECIGGKGGRRDSIVGFE
jgi:hypothetical protein